MSTVTGTYNKNYTESLKYIKMTRDAVIGEPALKSAENRRLYLPPPVCETTEDDVFTHRYRRYVASAEYDNVPSVTLEALLGGLNHQRNNYSELPAQMQYIIDDADGDGISLDEHIRIAQSELLQTKFCGLLAEYSDLASLGVGEEQLTVAQVKELGLRSSIKIYPRESIVNYDFRRINGVKQLAFVELEEVESVIGENFTTEPVTSTLILALDENGEYYQIKKSDKDEWSEPFYPMQAGGAKFKFIPFEFAIQGSYPKGVIPQAMGYLYSIVSKALHRYNMSAQMKESLWYSSSPITYTSGWTVKSFGDFKEISGGESLNVVPGGHWALPDGVTTGLLDFRGTNENYENYMKANAEEIRAIGGAFSTDIAADEMTATKAVIDAAERKSILSSLQAGLERSYSRVLSYCAMFEGVVDTFTIKLNREFLSNRITPQEQTAIRDNYTIGLIPRAEALRQLEKGGVLTVDAETLLNEIALSGE